MLIPHDSANGDIAFHRGLGGGAYAASTVVTAGIQSPSGSDFAVFDLNHDGRQDIITMPITTAPAGTSGFRVNVFFQIFRGQADGTFVPLATTPPDPGLNFPLLINDGANLSPAPAFAGFETDLDGDGFPDLLSTESYFPSIREWVVVKSSGGLDFQVKRSFAPSIEGSVSPQVVTDLDDDNKKDIVSITTRLTVRIPPATVAGAAWVSLGVGDGTFSNTKVDGSEDALKVVVRDLNMDGRLDLLVTFPPQRSPWVTPPYTCVVGMGVFYATDSGFKPPFATTVSGLDVFDPAFHGLINLCGGHVSLFVSPGPSQVIPGTDNALDVTVRDVNADQHQDLNITFPDGIKTFFGDGTGHFAP